MSFVMNTIYSLQGIRNLKVPLDSSEPGIRHPERDSWPEFSTALEWEEGSSIERQGCGHVASQSLLPSESHTMPSGFLGTFLRAPLNLFF